jgi:hypothetical protein
MAKKSKDVITIERMRQVFRGEELLLFPGCDRTELGMIFDIAEKRKNGEDASSAVRFFKENSGDLLEWGKVEEALRVLAGCTVIKSGTVYDKMTDGRLVRRYA